MKEPFDVWRYEFPDKGEHSVVLIGPPDRCARAAVVNALYCTSQRQSRKPYPFEVILNEADGFDWETFCDCSLMLTLPAAKLFGRRGRVTLERRRTIRQRVKDLFRLNAMD